MVRSKVVLHLYLLTRFSSHTDGFLWQNPVLHLYLLTRFSSKIKKKNYHTLVLHLYLLTRFSSARDCACSCASWFYTFIYLQGSQADRDVVHHGGGFTPLFTYKVLKLCLICQAFCFVLHLYLLTRFSSPDPETPVVEQVLHLYLLTRFSSK